VKNLKYFPYERNRYFYGKLLSVDDFQTEQKYMNDKRRLINRFLHGCGVVCGLNVVQIDDGTLSLETGLALDFSGREILVDTPVAKKLSMIEGFDSYTEEDEDNSYLYLCIEYAQKDKDPVYHVTGSASGGTEYNKVAESYHIYLTKKEPEGETFSSRYYFEEHKVVYWGNGVRISQVFPKYIRSGEEFEFRVILENMGQKLPVRFAYELSMDRLAGDDQNRMKIEFDEDNYEKARRYEISFLSGADGVKNTQGRAEVREGSFHLNIGGRQMDIDVTCASTADIIEDDIGEMISSRYYQEAMEEIVRDNYHQSIYLAKIGVIRAGTTFVIDEIERMPFQQYVYNGLLAAVKDRVANENIRRLERRLNRHRPGEESASDHPAAVSLDVPQVATGSAVIDLGIGGTAGQKFFTKDIMHGLGLGKVHITLGESYGMREESRIVFGADGIFEEEEHPVRAELAARADVTKGTFVIGLRLLETTTARQVKIHWAAVKDRKENLYNREERRLFIRPDMIYLKFRETYYFKPIFTGAADQRVTWRIKEAEGGMIDANGMYTAPNVPGIFEIIAESPAYQGLYASAFVVVKD